MTEFFGKLEKVVIWQICFFLKNMLTFFTVCADAAIKDNIIKSGNILNSLSQYVATFFLCFQSRGLSKKLSGLESKKLGKRYLWKKCCLLMLSATLFCNIQAAQVKSQKKVFSTMSATMPRSQ